jgi:hypothetical protein
MSPQKPSIGLSQSLLEKSGELVVELDWELKLVILTSCYCCGFNHIHWSLTHGIFCTFLRTVIL